MSNVTKSHAERVWEEEQEFLKNNQAEVLQPKKNGEKFRKEHGYSLTMSKLMEKWNCKTPDEYRVIRKKHKKENYIGPTKPKKIVEKNDNHRRN